ncbi:uncharacterized protein LOC110944369 [Helianthus annuus]|uniref:uncharacterized protein LOC110944369 n=1 Tax=Helianthus annuus TaxID=4232 RepID=UPI000B8EEEA1|nr:uncharacterized protein LOC110944369 [Helianthus annuus]
MAQYEKLRDYGEELLRSNPGSTVRIDVEPLCNPSSPTRQFRRMYVCLGALKQGFKLAGRPLLGLDGCFLKGPFPGQLLMAVGVDANNGIYPVAYAVVEAETMSSWTWFLKLLGQDFDIDANSYFCFISDRQKGLIPAVSKVFPRCEHRFCLRHIHENMKPRWKGELYKNLLWNCAAATTIQAFEKGMNTIKDEDKALHDWLKEIPAKNWCRAYFSGLAKCDILLNNICEVFNSQLIQGRDKPIITSLEFIREYLMKKHVVVQKLIAKCQGPLTPTATKVFEKIKSDAVHYSVIWTGGSKYQVTTHFNDHQDQRIVNVDDRSCSCRGWDVTGMPCRHAVACIWNMGLHGRGDGVPERWVDRAYWLQTWKDVYACLIDPINGMDMWPKSACPTTLVAPKYHAQVGRPKKKRKKSVVEIDELKGKKKPLEAEVEKLSEQIPTTGKMPRKGNSLTCKLCKEKGHNKRTCRNKPGVGQSQQSEHVP